MIWENPRNKKSWLKQKQMKDAIFWHIGTCLCAPKLRFQHINGKSDLGYFYYGFQLITK